MAHAQWIAIKIVSENMTLTVRNATIKPGKFHRAENQNAVISPSDINGITIKSGEVGWIFSSGRDGAAEGTTGHIDLYHGDIKVGRFKWDCPWLKKNSFNLAQVADEKIYYTKMSGGSRSGGIGVVTLILIKK